MEINHAPKYERMQYENTVMFLQIGTSVMEVIPVKPFLREIEQKFLNRIEMHLRRGRWGQFIYILCISSMEFFSAFLQNNGPFP